MVILTQQAEKKYLNIYEEKEVSKLACNTNEELSNVRIICMDLQDRTLFKNNYPCIFEWPHVLQAWEEGTKKWKNVKTIKNKQYIQSIFTYIIWNNCEVKENKIVGVVNTAGRILNSTNPSRIVFFKSAGDRKTAQINVEFPF